MATFILNAPRYAYREEPAPGRLQGKLVVKKRGDEVELDDEQVQRLQAGQEGSTFLTKEQFEKVNRQAFPEAIPDEAWPGQRDKKLGAAPGDDTPLPAPVSTTRSDAGLPLQDPASGGVTAPKSGSETVQK